MKGKGIAGCGRRELRREHRREYHNWVALVKGKLELAKRDLAAIGENSYLLLSL